MPRIFPAGFTISAMIFGIASSRAFSSSSDTVSAERVDSILEMAVSLPAMKRLGETIGMDLESALETKPKEGKPGE